MKKIYVLDTNVLMDNPECIINSFDENDLVIPLMVIEELDNLKSQTGEKGYSARQALRNLEYIRRDENVNQWIKRNEQGGRLKVVTITYSECETFNEAGFSLDKNDNVIVLTALKVRKHYDEKGMPVILVSNDHSVRVKGSLLDIPSQNYKESYVKQTTLDYQGYRNVYLPLEFFGSFSEKGKWTTKRLPQKLPLYQLDMEKKIDPPPMANEFLLLTPEDNDELSKKESKKLKSVYRYGGDEILYKTSLLTKDVYGGISGKNLEQSVALDVLLNDDIKVVALSGPAGSGKTLLSLSACLTKLLKEKHLGYERLILLKPTVSVSDEIGFLPGNVEEKLSQYMGSYFDNFSALRKMESVYTKSISSEESFEKMKDKGIIEIESISFLRGRSLSDCLIIVDEVQNVTQNVIKTILTRVGENCKIILLGDPSQIDRPYLSKHNNGLSHAIERLKGQDFFAHVKFVQGVRSIVSKKAAELL